MIGDDFHLLERIRRLGSESEITVYDRARYLNYTISTYDELVNTEKGRLDLYMREYLGKQLDECLRNNHIDLNELCLNRTETGKSQESNGGMIF